MAGTVRLQLEALGYAGAGAFAGPAGDADLAAWRPVVPWLEDTKVRHLPIAARAALRDTAAPGWEEAALGGYLRDLECPFAAGSLEAFRWLLSYAVMLEYQDNAVGFNSALAAAAAAGAAGGPGGPGAKRDEPAGPAGAEAEKPYADAGSAETAGAVEQLAAALGVAFDARDLSGTLERVIAGARSRGWGGGRARRRPRWTWAGWSWGSRWTTRRWSPARRSSGRCTSRTCAAFRPRSTG